MNSFKPDMSMVPPDLQEEVLTIARKYDNEMMSTEYTGEAGGDMVRVSVKYPGNVCKIKFNCELKDENKALLEDLLIAATERAFKKLDLSYRDLTTRLAAGIKDLVQNYIKEKGLDIVDDDVFN